MIDPGRLLADLTRLRADLEADLHERCDENPGFDAFLREEHGEAVARDRTASPYAAWRDDRLTQVAVAWILGCVFVRFLEDNTLVDPPRLSGSGERRQRALDEHTLYFREHPTDTDREYLLHVFRAVAALPIAGQLFDERHNPIWSIPESVRAPSGDTVSRLLRSWQRIDPDSGSLAHDFTDPAWDTRFLGDLYQDLSESARKQYALLQTPEFVEEFILDRTLTPAIDEFGFREVRLIDPACGSGHFLLGAFRRLERLWARHEPGTNSRERAARVLEQVAGVDLNPFAAAIARFRLCVAALLASGVKHLADAPNFPMDVVAGDSLLHGPRPGMAGARQEYLDPAQDPLGHVYRTEDAPALRAVLGRVYDVVVGNPPYITSKDKAQNQAYRARFGSCHRQYSLAVPFTERFFDLAREPARDSAEPAGFVGIITANSFMKREFGRKLIEEFIPQWDLTHVVDTSGAYIPGHGTPTVILVGRHRAPVNDSVRAVMGIRGEPTVPDDAAEGRVWSAIVGQIDKPESQGEFVSVSDLPRERLQTHPWTIGGGGAAELKERLGQRAPDKLGDLVAAIGRTTHTGEDDVFYLQPSCAKRLALDTFCIPLVIGENVRDYAIEPSHAAVFPYDKKSGNVLAQIAERLERHFWFFRTILKRRQDYGQTPVERGLRWFDHSMFFQERFCTPLSIAFPFVATHNHFVLDRGGGVFNRSAPVIKLRANATEHDHLGLLGLLNSSTACFWMKQVFYPKGGDRIGQEGARLRKTLWDERYEHDGTKLQRFPVLSDRPVELARQLDTLARELARNLPMTLVRSGRRSVSGLSGARSRARSIREQMIALQEELDWRCYRLYGVTEHDLCMPFRDVPAVSLGQRAFEIVLARRIAAGEVQTKWFERHGSKPITEIPQHWPAAYRALVHLRVETIEKNANIALIEQPEHKRRWNDEPWETQQERALRGWLLDRFEAPSLWSEPRLTTTAALADRARDDGEFLQVAELYTGRSDFDVAELVARLVENESVPVLPVLRYKPSGRRKREAWEHTWDRQRREDEIDASAGLPSTDPGHLTGEEAAALKAAEIGQIPVPPRATSRPTSGRAFGGACAVSWTCRGNASSACRAANATRTRRWSSAGQAGMHWSRVGPSPSTSSGCENRRAGLRNG